MANLIIIRNLSEEKKITLRELASRVNITDSALQKMIKTGSTSTSTLEKIALEFNVPVGMFFGENQASSENSYKEKYYQSLEEISSLKSTIIELQNEHRKFPAKKKQDVSVAPTGTDGM